MVTREVADGAFVVTIIHSNIIPSNNTCDDSTRSYIQRLLHARTSEATAFKAVEHEAKYLKALTKTVLAATGLSTL